MGFAWELVTWEISVRLGTGFGMIVLLLLKDYNLIFNYSYWTLYSNISELNNKCFIGYIPITLFISKN